MLEPEATPRCRGKFLDAAKRDEKYLSKAVQLDFGPIVEESLREYRSEASHEEEYCEVLKAGRGWLCDIIRRLCNLTSEQAKPSEEKQ
jgi:hypothetical protein